MPDNIIKGEAGRCIRLCIDSYERGVPVGRFYHPGLKGGGAAFCSLMELLLKVDRLLDETGFPQSYTAKRGFAPLAAAEPEGAAEDPLRSGKKATFIIRLMFRQHASWQGSLTWLEGRGEQSFRSVLELVILLDSALTAET